MAPSSIYAQTHQQKSEAYIKAVENAKMKVKAFKRALQSHDPLQIRKANLAIQSDPAAIKELNKENPFIRKRYVDTTKSIKAKTLEGIKQRVAQKYHVDPSEVNVMEFTNPSSTVKAGHDWDVTVTIRNKEVNFRDVKEIVHESYFEAAGGKKAYPNSDPQHFSETHHVEVTSSHHAEAYEGGEEYIKDPKKYKVKDPERLSKTIEHKSHLEQEKAAEYTSRGESTKSEIYRQEQARQYTKQYDKHIKPRIKERGGRIHDHIEKGTKILKKIGRYDKELGRTYTPADADAELAKIGKHGETMESIIQKGSALAESAEKLKGPTKKTRLKKKLGHAYDDLDHAFTQQNKKGMRQAKKKIARVKQELKGELSSSKPKLKSGEKIPAVGGGAAAAEEGMVAKGMKAAGEVANHLGAGMVIFNTSEDIKQSLKGEKSWKETGKNVADAATFGAISSTEQVAQKASDYHESKKAIQNAKEQENERYIQKAYIALRKHGVPKEEADAIREDLQRGDRHSLYNKVMELKRSGTKIRIERKREVEDVEADDTIGERTKEVGKGLLEYGERAGGFLVQTGKDIIEIDRLKTEIREEEMRARTTHRMTLLQYDQMRKKLIAMGASPEAADAALIRYREGHKSTLDHLIQSLHQQQSSEEDARMEPVFPWSGSYFLQFKNIVPTSSKNSIGEAFTRAMEELFAQMKGIRLRMKQTDTTLQGHAELLTKEGAVVTDFDIAFSGKANGDTATLYFPDDDGETHTANASLSQNGNILSIEGEGMRMTFHRTK
jgi:hypothetical protein